MIQVLSSLKPECRSSAHLCLHHRHQLLVGLRVLLSDHLQLLLDRLLVVSQSSHPAHPAHSAHIAHIAHLLVAAGIAHSSESSHTITHKHSLKFAHQGHQHLFQLAQFLCNLIFVSFCIDGVVPVAISNSSLSRSGWCSKHSSLMMVLRKMGTNCFSCRAREAASSTSCVNSFGPWAQRNSVLILIFSRTCSTVISVLRMSSCMNGASSGPYLAILAWVSPREVRTLFCSCCSCMIEFCRAIVLSSDCLKYSERRFSLISLGKSLLRSSLCLLERVTVLDLRYEVRTMKTLRMSSKEGLLRSISAFNLLSSS